MVKEKADNLDDFTDQILNEESATGEAIKSLINVKDRETGKSSEVELKTDLTDDEVKVHTVLDVLSSTLEMDEQKFSTNCILSNVIEKKERKALSKNRQSRSEIVAVARHPDMNTFMNQDLMQRQGFIKRFFTSRKNRDMGGILK